MKTKKFKVLIADDEYWTREKIRRMIQWEAYGLEFMEPAVDGEDVLRKIEQDAPDMLITDINMPFISGVELIKIVTQKYPEIICFVISGYDDFDYVRETLTNGAVNYLLKPVSKIDLVNALSKSLEIISQRQKQQAQQQEDRLRLLKASSFLLDHEFSNFLQEREAAFTPNISLNSSLDIAGNSVMLVKIHDLREIKTAYQYDLNLYSYNTKVQIKSFFEGCEVMVFNNTASTNEFLIFSNIDFEKVGEIAEKMLKGLERFAKSVITIIINEHSFSVDNLRDVYKQTIALLQFRPFSRESLILTTRQGQYDESALGKAESLGPQQFNDLNHLIESGHEGTLLNWIRHYLDLDQEAGRLTFTGEKRAAKDLILMLNRRIQPELDSAAQLQMEEEIDEAERVIDRIDKDTLSETFAEIIDVLMQQRAEPLVSSTEKAVENAIGYVTAHYAEKITLTDLARRFGVSSSYFSTMFSRQTGENLMAYIMRLRFEKAAELIRSEEISLNEAAFMVGYEDYAYFSRIFRKIMGCSPREYRNKIHAKAE